MRIRAVRGRKWLGGGLLAGLVALAPARVDAQTQIVEYYATDALGSIRVVFDPGGTVKAQSDYLPFGQPLTPSGNLPAQRFTGQERDSETTRDHFNARSLIVRAGRFGSVDPIQGSPGQPQSWNRYAYVHNNPLGLVDPTGMKADEKEDKECRTTWDPEKWEFKGCHTSSTTVHTGSPILTTIFAWIERSTFPADDSWEGFGVNVSNTVPNVGDPLPVPSAPVIPTTVNAPGASPAQLAALMAAIKNVDGRLKKPSCGNLFGGEVNARMTLWSTEFRFVPLGSPAYANGQVQATGAHVPTHFPPRVHINSQGPFVNQNVQGPNWTATFAFPGVAQADYPAVMLAHELGHTVNEMTMSIPWNPLGSFPPDARNPTLNTQITQSVIARCF